VLDEGYSGNASCTPNYISRFKLLIILTGLEQTIRVITKLPNSEQSYKGKVETHKYINRQNQSTTGKL
jgi:hypothetical protein